MTMVHDALIIGGGPAGLIAATYLARFRRSVVLVDAGRSRAASIPRSHNYPGFAEGISGTRLITSLREQAGRYQVDTAVGCVETLSRRADGMFEARWASGTALARTVLLATGGSDIAPDMPYLDDALREGALRYCPVCDGFEVIDRPVGVLIDGPHGIGEALYLQHFTRQLTVFRSHADVVLDNAARQRLADAAIALEDDPVKSIRLWNGQAVVHHASRQTAVDAVYSALGMKIHSDLARSLGAETDGAGYLAVDRHNQTTVEGLYAAGDVSQGLNQISVASGGAAVAASAMHQALRG
jgi:thioredoxin reductase (NADPH)